MSPYYIYFILLKIIRIKNIEIQNHPKFLGISTLIVIQGCLGSEFLTSGEFHSIFEIFEFHAQVLKLKH